MHMFCTRLCVHVWNRPNALSCLALAGYCPSRRSARDRPIRNHMPKYSDDMLAKNDPDLVTLPPKK
jgi:hypothetical protein